MVNDTTIPIVTIVVITIVLSLLLLLLPHLTKSIIGYTFDTFGH